MSLPTSRPRARGLFDEWPTWVALAACYGLWGAVLVWHARLGVGAYPLLAVLAAFHSSLTHEVCHGHPTRHPLLNEALVFPPLMLLLPYRRFRDLHLRHHNDDRLTDPLDDPESWYVEEAGWREATGWRQDVLAFNATLAGRMLIGPALSIAAFARSETALIARGASGVRGAWVRHGVGAAGVALAVWAAGMPLWAYLIGVAYPAMSLLMIRTYIEHRAAHCPKQRSAIVEAGPVFSLLFLNNNLHRVHHERPSLPWYALPALWRAERQRILAENGGYWLNGYGEVFAHWLFRRREPVVHPLLRRRHRAPRAGRR